MKNLQDQIFKKFKIKDVFPFYIRNVNGIFLDEQVKEDKKHKYEHELSDHNFLDKKTITEVINVILSKIVSITGTEASELLEPVGYDDYGNKMYISQTKSKAYARILGNKQEENFFSYQINISPNNYLYELVDGIDLSFYLNKETKHITGGFGWRNFKFNASDNHLINNFYFVNLVNTFLETELFPLSMNNLLNIFKKEDGQSEDFYSALKEKWDALIHASYQNEEPIQEVQYIINNKDKIFQRFLILIFLMIHVLEQLDDYFTNKNVHDFLHSQLKKNDFGNNQDQDESQDLQALVNYLNNHTDINSYEVIKNHIYYKYDNYTISEPVEFYEIALKDEVVFLDTESLIKNKLINSILSVLLFPKSFGLGSANLFQMNYSMLTDLVYENLNNENLSFINEDKKEDILSSICEINFDYVSMIKNNRVVILENNNEVSQEVVEEVSQYYFWAEIYLQSKILELKDIENYVNYFFRSNEKWKIITFRKIIRDLHDLDFNENDSFYGAPQIKHIVSHIDTKNDYHDLLHKLTLKVKNEDEIYKRQTERMSIIVAFMVALMIGYIDFFACIYSVAPCSYSNINWGWILSSVITGSVFAFINLVILMTTLVYLVMSRTKVKEIENRKDRNLYFGYNNSPLAQAAQNNRGRTTQVTANLNNFSQKAKNKLKGKG